MDCNFLKWSLEEVLEFYDSGDPNRSAFRAASNSSRQKLTAEQKAALTGFLTRLTETTASNERKFSNLCSCSDYFVV